MTALILVLIFNLQIAWGQDNSEIYDSSYARDNSYCKWKGQRIEIKLKGPEQYTEFQDREYGPLVFILRGDSKTTPIHIKDFFTGRYRFLKSSGGLCTKSLSISRNDKLIFFLLRDNRPLNDELVYFIFDQSKNSVSTRMTDENIVSAYLQNNHLVFASAFTTGNEKSGKTVISQKDFSYTEKKLVLWKEFDGLEIQTNEKMTYEKSSELKSLFTYNEFLEVFHWDKVSKTFKTDTYFIASNLNNKERCISPRLPQHWKCQKGGK